MVICSGRHHLSVLSLHPHPAVSLPFTLQRGEDFERLVTCPRSARKQPRIPTQVCLISVHNGEEEGGMEAGMDGWMD